MSILECKNLCKQYGNIKALDKVNLSVEPGRIVGLLGPNGSGKTTLIKLCNGLITPTNGLVHINGMKPSPATKAMVSYLPERNALPLWMNAEQAIEYYADFYADFSKEAASGMIAHLGLDNKQQIKSLSKGMREKLQLVLVMSRRARLYLLDEPMGGVDPAARDYIIRTIISNYAPEASVIISTHLISDVEQILDEVIFLKDGQVVYHESVDALRDKTGKSIDELFREVFKC